MRCEICNECVFGEDGITVLGIGAAHVACFEMEKNIRREFGNINISRLNDEDFNDLYDMVMAERNVRASNFEEKSIELF